MKTIAFLSVKGGVGKTTLTVNTAHMLAEIVKGSDRVLILDLDAQASASLYVLGHENLRKFESSGVSMYDALR